MYYRETIKISKCWNDEDVKVTIFEM